MNKAHSGFQLLLVEDDAEAVRLGPFPKYDLQEIEESIGGWMRVTADKLNAAAIDKRQELLDELNTQFAFSVDIADRGELPGWPQGRIAGGEDIVFYSPDARPDDQWFAATPLSGEKEVVRFGPFPNFERVEQKATTTTLALVLLPAALVKRIVTQHGGAAEVLTSPSGGCRLRTTWPIAQPVSENDRPPVKN